MYDNDDHIAVPNWPDLEETRSVWEIPAQRTQVGETFEIWIRQEKKEKSTKDTRWKESPSSLYSKFAQ